MTIFLVVEGDYEYEAVIGVFDSKEAAKQCVRNSKAAEPLLAYCIEKWEVNGKQIK